MFHVKHEPWGAAATRIGVDLPPGASERLDGYERLLRDRAVPAGLIAAGDADRLRERHVLDCLRGAPLVPAVARTLVDLGSGAGLPGVVIAIARPAVAVVLVERRRARAAFLELVVDLLGLDAVRVHLGDAATVDARFDVATARAFGDPRRSWDAAERLLAPGGRLLYWAGEAFVPQRDAPPGVEVTVPGGHALARGGPVVIMARQ